MHYCWLLMLLIGTKAFSLVKSRSFNFKFRFGVSRFMSSFELSSLQQNLRDVETRVSTAVRESERELGSVTLIAVSKTKPASAIQELYDVGQRDFGENYFQELCDKAAELPKDIKWHFIGHLQSSKSGPLIRNVPNLCCVETVDSEKLATKLNTACVSAERREVLDILIQIDTSGEDTKSGVPTSEACALAAFVTENCPQLRVRGLMTIGAPGDASCFDRLVECRNDLSVTMGVTPSDLQLSMGMSGDFETAIARGSTRVRVGSTLFGAREYLGSKPDAAAAAATATATAAGSDK